MLVKISNKKKFGDRRNDWNKKGIHIETGTRYNPSGWDRKGFNILGYNRFGYNKKGWNKQGYNRFG